MPHVSVSLLPYGKAVLCSPLPVHQGLPRGGVLRFCLSFLHMRNNRCPTGDIFFKFPSQKASFLANHVHLKTSK